MDGMRAGRHIERTLNKIGLRLVGWLGLPVSARVGARVFKTFLRHNTNQYFEPCSRSKCLFVNLFELVVLLTGSFHNMLHHLGIMPRAWLESTFICHSTCKRAQIPEGDDHVFLVETKQLAVSSGHDGGGAFRLQPHHRDLPKRRNRMHGLDMNAVCCINLSSCNNRKSFRQLSLKAIKL